MQHHFDVDFATAYGVLEAVLFNHIEYWTAKNEANGVNYYDGRYWTYNSARAFSLLFPYASKDKIARALKHLRDEGLIEVGNYNEQAYDRTLWYTLSTAGKTISQGCKMDDANLQNGSGENAQAIPNKKTQIKNADNNKAHPTVEEVRAYCAERKNGVDAQRWFDYYTANGWRVGRNPMKDWKAAVRTWERNAKEAKQYTERDSSLDDIL